MEKVNKCVSWFELVDGVKYWLYFEMCVSEHNPHLPLEIGFVCTNRQIKPFDEMTEEDFKLHLSANAGGDGQE